MAKIYSYVSRYDDGAAPNPYWGVCTLAICKPKIRKKAKIGDWVLGTGNRRFGNSKLVYAMKITDIKTLEEYEMYCKNYLKNKIPQWTSNDFRLKVGDCIYDYSDTGNPKIRKSVHDERNIKKDLSGKNVLLSDYFYYFGDKPVPIPEELKEIIKIQQGHKIIKKLGLVRTFEDWVNNFKRNNLYGEPQLKNELKFSKSIDIICAIRDLKDDT